MKDYKYSLEIMKKELENRYVCPEIKYAFQSSVEALEKQTPRKVCWTLECYIEKWHCPTCGRIYWEKEFIEDYCSSCGQRLVVE